MTTSKRPLLPVLADLQGVRRALLAFITRHGDEIARPEHKRLEKMIRELGSIQRQVAAANRE